MQDHHIIRHTDTALDSDPVRLVACACRAVTLLFIIVVVEFSVLDDNCSTAVSLDAAAMEASLLILYAVNV